MKKLIVLALSLSFTVTVFAQKDQIKAIEKALNSSNFDAAQSALPAAEALLGTMDDKTKANFYFLKAQAFYAKGTGSDENLDTVIGSIKELKTLEAATGKLKYTKLADEISSEMLNSLTTKANNAISSKDYKSAASKFTKLYQLSPKDTLYLYYAASTAVSVPDYDTALLHYIELKKLGYTGITTNYIATNVATGEEENFPNKMARDISVKTKLHSNPKDEKTTSNKAEIVKNIALIYVAQGNNDKALSAMADARAENPDDLGLLLSEASVYLKMGDRAKFKQLMEDATEKDPNNPELQYNLGVIAAESGSLDEAKRYYNKAIAINPEYTDAYINLAVAILGVEATIIEKMNNLGNSAADNRKYDELKEQRSQLYAEAIPYLEKALELKPSNIDAAKTLMNIYSSLGEMDKFKAMRTKVEAMEASASGN